MICPHIVNVSMLLGSILTWGWLWPYIDGRAGVWYADGLKEHDFKGLFGYRVSKRPLYSCTHPAHGFAQRHCLSMVPREGRK